MAIALAELLKENQIQLDLRATNRSGAVRELADLLAANESLREAEKFAEQVLKAERKNSTFDDGVAFPHARTQLVDEIVLAIGRSVAGVPWTPTGERAHLIFLIAVPQKLISDYLVVVGAIARVTKDHALRTLLLHAETKAEFIETMLAAPSL
jgi:mannitol/fructose-specific phosphotransferase system IIA component (Ntr-type)